MATTLSDGERKDGSPSESEVTMDPMEICTGVSVLGKRNPETRDAENVEEKEEDGDIEVEEDEEDSDDSRWDKDSFDGREYNSDDSQYEGLDSLSRRHCRKVIESKGFFDASVGTPYYVLAGIGGVPDLDDDSNPETFCCRDLLSSIASDCVDKYNRKKKDENKKVIFHSVLRANFHSGYPTTYYITFSAKESDSPDAPLVEYQAKADRAAQKTYPILCRPSPPTKGTFNITLVGLEQTIYT